MKNNKPSFFIVGSPKCGTTALAKYLSEHKDIFMSSPKEPHYFATNFDDSMRIAHTEKHYLSLFKNAKENQLSGEASIWYLYSKEAIKNLAKFEPNAKIIVMVRNPADMIYSLHSQKIYSLDEDVLDFGEAWDLSWEREKGNFIPPRCREPKTLYYHKIANYDEQIKYLYKFFPKNNVKIIEFQKFQESNLDAYKDVLAFLNIKYDGKKEFQKINERKVYKSDIAANLINFKRSKSLKSITDKIKEKLGIVKLPIWSHFNYLIKKLNTKTKKAYPMSQKMKKVIDSHYGESYKKLLEDLKSNG
jgi:hypothetical protein